MGTYVQFWHGAEDGLLGHFLSGPLGDFRAWCINTIEEFPGEIDPSILPLLEKIQSNGWNALAVKSPEDASIVDRLLDTYYGSFCDLERKELFEMTGDAVLYVRRYDSIGEALAASSDKRVESQLWSYVRSGRAAGRDQTIFPYLPGGDVFRLSFWSAAEVALLGRVLTSTPAEWLRDADPDALECTLMAIESALARHEGLIITVA